MKEYEVANVKYEENLKYHKKIEEIKKQMDKKYLENVRRIKEREENALKLCKAKISVKKIFKYEVLIKFALGN